MKSLILLAFCASLAASAELTRDPAMCKRMPNMVSWLSDACTFKNVCFNGQLVSQPNECPEHASCGKEDGQMACVCNAPFQWDTNKKTCIDLKNPAKPADPKRRARTPTEAPICPEEATWSTVAAI